MYSFSKIPFISFRLFLSFILGISPTSLVADAHELPSSDTQIISLEAQIDVLTAAGIVLAEGVTIDDVRYSFGDKSYENDPFSLLLFVYGVEIEREPWGRPFSDSVWNFDYEYIYGEGSYVEIVERLVRLTGNNTLLNSVNDKVDIETFEIEIAYALNSDIKMFTAALDGDWADHEAVITIAHDIEAAVSDGRRYWAMDNGQAKVLLFITNELADQLNGYGKNFLQPFE